MLWIMVCKNLLPIFLQNILYKTFFIKDFVENIYKFYNFVEINYSRMILLVN